MKTLISKSRVLHFWLLLASLFALQSQAQTVFIFNKSSGNYDFQNATTWTNNAVPQNGDVLSFVGIGASTLLNVPAIHLSNIINDGGGILLFGSTTALGTALQSDNLTFNNEVGFGTATAFNIVVGNVSGAAAQRLTYGFGINVTVTGTFIDNGASFFNGWTASSLTFASGSVYKAAYDVSYIPTATWLPGSMVSITGVTSTNQINNTNQAFYDFYIDSPRASSSILLDNITCLGTFAVKTVGGVAFTNNSDYHFNNLYLNDGTIQIGNLLKMHITGNVTQTGGSFTSNNSQFLLDGSNNQNVQLTNLGSCDVIVANTGVTDHNIISLTGGVLFNSLNINSGTVSLNAFTHTFLGVIASTNGDMKGSSLSGLVFPGNPGGGTCTLPAGTGTLKTLLMNRQFNNHVYLAGNLTITGELQSYDNGDLYLNGHNLVMTGILQRNSAGSDLDGASASTLFFANGSTYIHNFDGGNVASATWMTGSTCSITGSMNSGPGNLANQNFYDLAWNTTLQTEIFYLLGGPTDNLSVSGTLRIINTGMSNSFIKIKNGNGTDVGDIMINNYLQSGGILVNDQYGGTQGYSSFTIYGNISLTGGLLSLSTNGNYSGGFPLTLAGGNSTIGNTGGTILGVSDFIVKKNAGASAMLSTDLSIAQDLTFQKGNISTGMYKLWVAGTINGASSTTGWVNGNLAKNISTGSNKIAFYEVGTATVYAPVTLTFPGVSTAGAVVASVTDGNNPNIGQSCINEDKSINKYWMINTIGGTSLDPFAFDASFMFDQTTDVDAGTNLSNVKAFVYDGANWSTSASVPTVTSTAIGLSGLSIPGAYYLAETAPKISTITGSPLSCLDGSISVYSVLGNNCSTSFLWSISGGNFTTTGNTISVIWTSTGINQLAIASSDGVSSSAISMLNVTISSSAPTGLLSSITGMESVTVSSQVVTYSAISVLGVNYMWTISGGGTLTASNNSASVVWTMPGTFTLSTMPYNGCGTGLISTLTVTVVSVTGGIIPTLPGSNLSISIVSSGSVITDNKGTLQLSATVSPIEATVTGIIWTSSDNSIATVSSSGLVTAVANGTVIITASVSDNLSISSTLAISISGQIGTTTGIARNLLAGVSLYPNPATTSFTIQAEPGNYIVDIYSIQGVSVGRKVITESSTFSTDGLNAGSYFIKIQNGDTSKTFRLVITK